MGNFPDSDDSKSTCSDDNRDGSNDSNKQKGGSCSCDFTGYILLDTNTAYDIPHDNAPNISGAEDDDWNNIKTNGKKTANSTRTKGKKKNIDSIMGKVNITGTFTTSILSTQNPIKKNRKNKQHKQQIGQTAPRKIVNFDLDIDDNSNDVAIEMEYSSEVKNDKTLNKDKDMEENCDATTTLNTTINRGTTIVKAHYTIGIDTSRGLGDGHTSCGYGSGNGRFSWIQNQRKSTKKVWDIYIFAIGFNPKTTKHNTSLGKMFQNVSTRYIQEQSIQEYPPLPQEFSSSGTNHRHH